jgi:hypothetical protein
MSDIDMTILFPSFFKLTCRNVLKVLWKKLRFREDISIDHNATRFIKNTTASKYHNCESLERGKRSFSNTRELLGRTILQTPQPVYMTHARCNNNA